MPNQDVELDDMAWFLVFPLDDGRRPHRHCLTHETLPPVAATVLSDALSRFNEHCPINQDEGRSPLGMPACSDPEVSKRIMPDAVRCTLVVLV